MPVYHYNNHLDLFYDVVNPSAERTLICLHGWGTSRHLWKRVERYLNDWRIIKIDLPGMGQSSYHSDLASGKYISKTAEIIDGLLSHLDIEEASILSHSIGGIVAAQLQSISSVRMNHLVFESTPLLGGKGLSFKIRLFGMNRLIRTPLYMALRIPRVTRKLIYNTFEKIDSVPREIVEQLIHDFGVVDANVLYQSWKSSVATIAIDKLRQCHSRMLYITGENNLTLDRKAMARALTDKGIPAKVSIIPDARHYPQLEKPLDYYREIKTFLDA